MVGTLILVRFDGWVGGCCYHCQLLLLVLRLCVVGCCHWCCAYVRDLLWGGHIHSMAPPLDALGQSPLGGSPYALLLLPSLLTAWSFVDKSRWALT